MISSDQMILLEPSKLQFQYLVTKIISLLLFSGLSEAVFA